MTNTPLPCQGLNIRIPTVIPIRGRGFLNGGSGLSQTTAGSLITGMRLRAWDPRALISLSMKGCACGAVRGLEE